ncbi:MAG TPA: glycoside hydrolase family 3 C-terminal domain-containing protein, partial [Vicinamibacteria bacterium]|nr:glycoside hydrolase family 3 C-terminal domain-containing protein [Vicinamibacteria bacterium]
DSGGPSSGTPDQRADQLLAQMTLDEKLQLVHGGAAADWWNHTLPHGGAGWVPGIPRLGIPDLYLADGSVGLGNAAGPATALPSSIASAASWDLDLAYQYGKVIGAESRARGINVNLGGNVNLAGREPRCGRTFETKGEDPVLAGRIAGAHLKAIQDQHVIAGVKHFALNDQETGRTTADVRVDERSARESDLLAFEVALSGSDAQSVMCSYNLLQSDWACESAFLLDGVLKGDWGFRGFVMSDWDATHTTAKAAQAGLDQEQPDSLFFGADLKQAMQGGQVPQSRLDDMVHRILRAMSAAGLFENPVTVGSIDAAAGATAAQQAEEQGAVLLKNDGLLPLDPALPSIAVIGSHADIGVLSGGGSAQVTPIGGPALTEGTPCPPCWSQVMWVPSSPLNAIRARAASAQVRFDAGTDPASAAALASASTVAVVLASQWESEGMDRPSLNLVDVIHGGAIDQDAVITAVARANPRTVVVIESGGAVAMPWLGGAGAVLAAWYPGQKGGEAIAGILFGAVDPSGKLPITFPARVEDLPRPQIPAPAGGSAPFVVDYTIDGASVGYKWFDSRGVTPLFPFGFGLSYTTFALSNPQLAATVSGDVGFQLGVDVQNTGSRTGAEVAQVYLGLPSATGEPKRLVGWRKVTLAPGATQRVTVDVRASDAAHSLSYWDTTGRAWHVASGAYTVYVGNSSRNLTTAGGFQVP